MQLGVVFRTLGVLFLLFSTTLVPPAIVSILYDDGEFVHFSLTFAVALLAGVALWLPCIASRIRFAVATVSSLSP